MAITTNKPGFQEFDDAPTVAQLIAFLQTCDQHAGCTVVINCETAIEKPIMAISFEYPGFVQITVCE